MKGKEKRRRTGIIRDYDMGQPSVHIGLVFVYALCVAIALAALLPALWVLLAGMKNIQEFLKEPSLLPKSLDFSVFADTWKQMKFEKYYVSSFLSVGGSVVCAIVFNGLTAYGLSVIKPKGHKVVHALIMWSLLIPSTVSIVPLFMNISMLGLRGSFLPLWLCAGANAFYVVLFKQFFDRFPRALVEAARIDGCGNLGIFFKIIVPLSKGIVTVVAIYAIVASWSDFLLPYLVLNQSGNETVMVRLFQFKNSTATDVDVLRAIAFAIIPPILLFLACSKRITKSVMEGGIKE